MGTALIEAAAVKVDGLAVLDCAGLAVLEGQIEVEAVQGLLFHVLHFAVAVVINLSVLAADKVQKVLVGFIL